MKSRWFTCDEVCERSGVEECCIVSEGALENMPEPEEGSMRCTPHGQLLGTRRPIYAYSEDDARQELRNA